MSSDVKAGLSSRVGSRLLRPLMSLLVLMALSQTCFAQTVGDIEKLFEQANYRAVAVQGARALAQFPKDDGLRFKVANSLAWTGRYDAAIVQYERLFGSEFDGASRLGIANIYRWRGMPELAAPYVRAVLEKNPGSSEAKIAQRLLARDIGSAVTIRLADGVDNSQYNRRDLSLNWRRLSEDLTLRTELGAVFGGDSYPGAKQNFRALTGSVAAPLIWGAPKLDLAIHQRARTRAFAGLSLEPFKSVVPELLQIKLAQVDFARQAFSAKAILTDLRANQFGLRSRIESPLGNLAGRFDLYKISDANRILDGELKFTPYWQPLPAGVMVDLGVSGRKADSTSANYWSPSKTYGLATVGVRKPWYWDEGELTLGFQHGIKLTDEARNNLSFSANGKYWIDTDMALGFDFWWSKAPRPGDYRTRSIGISLQHHF